MAAIMGALLDEGALGSSVSSSAVDHLACFADFGPFLGKGLAFSLDLLGVGLGLGAGGSCSAISSEVSEVAGAGSGASRSILASGPSAGAIPGSNMTVAAGWFGFEAPWIIGLAGTGAAGSSMLTSMSASGAGRASAGAENGGSAID
jgi:hypothetical protein